MLNWHSYPYKPGSDIIVGTYLAVTFVEPLKRFAIYERRTRAWEPSRQCYYLSVTYDVKDAETVSDDAIRAGKVPLTVFSSDDLDKCVAWIERKKIT